MAAVQIQQRMLDATRRKHIESVPNPSTAEIFAHQHGKCILCGEAMQRTNGDAKHPDGVTIEHVFPRSLGFGLYANKAFSHWRCNHARHDAWPSAQTVDRARALYRGLLPRAITRQMWAHPLFAWKPPAQAQFTARSGA